MLRVLDRPKAAVADCTMIHSQHRTDDEVGRAVWRAENAQSKTSSNHPKTQRLEQRPPHRTKETTATETGLGHPGASRVGQQFEIPDAFQCCNRWQVVWMRYGLDLVAY
jgi:hypothetical protein